MGSGRRGQALALVAVLLVGLLGMAGLALDSGRAYLHRVRLSRAVDGGVLAAARSLRSGEEAARAQARAVAAANGFFRGGAGVDYTLSFGANEHGEQTITMMATQPMATTFMRMLGWNRVDVAASAVAAVPPVDLVLVLDQSGSLATFGAWEQLQDAARGFVEYFDDGIDQLGLVSFQIRAEHDFRIARPFKAAIRSEIDRMTSAGDTNTGEGLRAALDQLRGGDLRERSVRVVVLFTDGRPTAFRGMIGGADRAIAVPIRERGQIRGLFHEPDRLPMNQLADPDDCAGVHWCQGWSSHAAREEARRQGAAWADRIRAEDVYLYVIALGNPDVGDPLEAPDLPYLRALANEGGIADPDQPQGRMYFAPTADELREVFDRLARDLLVRLAQ